MRPYGTISYELAVEPILLITYFIRSRIFPIKKEAKVVVTYQV